MAAYKHINSKGIPYYLYSEKATLRGGKEQMIYFFAQRDDRPGALPGLPLGYSVQENARNGFLTLKRGMAHMTGQESKEPLEYSAADLALPETKLHIARLSPSFALLERILESSIALDRLHWREFEELVADLLMQDGYAVTLGPGTKDGGVDIIAAKELEGVGWFMAVWQAKRLKPGNKVELSVIRELADTRTQHKASKGMIVTNSYLTSGALERVRQDQFILGKVDRDDLMQWIQRVKRRSRNGELYDD